MQTTIAARNSAVHCTLAVQAVWLTQVHAMCDTPNSVPKPGQRIVVLADQWQQIVQLQGHLDTHISCQHDVNKLYRFR